MDANAPARDPNHEKYGLRGSVALPEGIHLVMAPDAYPDKPAERDRWILGRRGNRHLLNPRRPHAFFLEPEPDETGRLLSCATIFLTNRECPWRCLMCDLWQNTLTESVPPGAIPAQIEFALSSLSQANPDTASPLDPANSLSSRRGRRGPGRGRPSSTAVAPVDQIKLYNSGSFFDPRAIPPGDHPAIARQIRGFGRVVTECHPALINESAVRFRDLLDGKLEIAIGLETAHPPTLEKLNKRMTLDQFSFAAEFLRRHAIALRVFLLVQPPFIPDPAEALEWARRSVTFAFDCGAAVVSLIPTRAGNGALEELARGGQFAPPTLATFETALAEGLATRRGRVFADLWDLNAFSRCAACFPARQERLAKMNLSQRIEPDIACAVCNGSNRPMAHA